MSARLDLALAARSLGRRPGFTTVAVTTIALAIAANTAIFSVVSGVLLKPLPFRNPERQVTLDVRAPTGFLVSISMPNYRDWRDRSRVFEAYAGGAGWGFTLTGRGPAQVVDAEVVLGDFFGTLGMTAALGRPLTPDETPDRAGGESVVLVGHRFWRETLGGDSAAVGQTLILDGKPFTIMGVLPANVGFPVADIAVYVPMATVPSIPWDDRDSGFGTRAIARLRPGVTLEAARRDLARVGQEVRDAAGPNVPLPELRSLEVYFVGDIRTQLWVLMGAVGFVLLIAVANVGNLLLARGEDRQKELAVRAALGADRSALIRLLLTEALLLAVIGGALGVGAAHLAVGVMIPLLPADVPSVLLSRIRVDTTVMAVGVMLAILTGLLFGLVPAIRSTGGGLATAVKSGGRTTAAGGGRLRSALVVAEVALALVLLVSAGLMLRSLDRLSRVDKGFESSGVLTAAVSRNEERYPAKEGWRAFYRELRDRAEALPGVRSAALALLLPLGQRSWELGIWPEGMPTEEATRQSVLYNIVSPEYFSTMSVPILRGRGFGVADRDGGPPVTIIDDTMAERFWPGEDPIGKRVTFESDSAGALYRTVVGVARNVRHYQLTSPSRIQVYVPFDQTLRRWGMGIRLVLKTEGAPIGLTESVRATAATMDPDAPVSEIRPLDDLVGGAMGQSRAMTRVLTAFGATALAMAALGIFGVMSYLVARRTREIGIRIALGAGVADVIRWIGGRALRLTFVGAGLGIAGAVAVTRLLRGILFEVSPLDPAIFGFGTLGLGVVAMLAAYLPARRAARVDPVAALSEEG